MVTRPGINTSAINSSSNGYVELPYTLPQDFTLFVLLREKTPEIWMRKLDWIAQHGGMALVDVHPDYLCLDNAIATSREYPVAHYKSFLEYVSKRYEGAFWNPIPRRWPSSVLRSHEPARERANG